MKKLVLAIAISLAMGSVHATGWHKPKTPTQKQNQAQMQGQAQGQLQGQAQKSYNKNYNKNNNSSAAKSYAGAAALSNSRSNSKSRSNSNSSSNNRVGVKTIIDIEGDNVPEIASSVPPSVASNCTISSAVQGIDAGISSAFPEASCQAFAVANYHWAQYNHWLGQGRMYGQRALDLMQEFNASQSKHGRPDPDLRAELLETAQQADGYYEKAKYHLAEKDKFERKGVGIVSRALPFGEVGGILVRVFPFLEAREALK